MRLMNWDTPSGAIEPEGACIDLRQIHGAVVEQLQASASILP
jgi:hypothetical protein